MAVARVFATPLRSPASRVCSTGGAQPRSPSMLPACAGTQGRAGACVFATAESESESPPDPLTRGLPFRHDFRNGEAGAGKWDTAAEVLGGVQAAGGEALPRSRGTCAEMARELGCDAGSISDRVKRADAAQASPEDSPFKAAEENRRLRREVERLRREDEMLLEASAFLAGRQL